MTSPRAVLVACAAVAVLLAACSSDDDSSAATTVTSSDDDSQPATEPTVTTDTAAGDTATSNTSTSETSAGGTDTTSAPTSPASPASTAPSNDGAATTIPTPRRPDDPLGPVPEEWPDDIPRPDGFGVDSEVISDEPDTDDVSIFIGGPESEVGEGWFEGYLEEFDEAGYERIVDLSYEDSSVVTFDNGEWRVSLTRGPGFEGIYIGINFVPSDA